MTTPYNDIEQSATVWLKNEFPDCHATTETPPWLGTIEADGTVRPVIAVAVIGGQDPRPTLDRPQLTIDVYGPADDVRNGTGRSGARKLATLVWTTMKYSLPGTVFSDGASVTQVGTISRPNYLAYANEKVRRFSFSVLVTVHNPNVG